MCVCVCVCMQMYMHTHNTDIYIYGLVNPYPPRPPCHLRTSASVHATTSSGCSSRGTGPSRWRTRIATMCAKSALCYIPFKPPLLMGPLSLYERRHSMRVLFQVIA